MRKLLALWLAAIVIFAWGTSASAAAFAYIANSGSNDLSVIDTSTNTVLMTASVAVGLYTQGVAVTPDEISMATNTVVATVPVGLFPQGVAVTPDGAHAYIANTSDNTVSMIDTTTNTVTATVAVGSAPIAWSKFIH